MVNDTSSLKMSIGIASGYRLPTEAEWGKGGEGKTRLFFGLFPWGNSIDGSMANYKLSGDPYDDGAPQGVITIPIKILSQLK